MQPRHFLKFSDLSTAELRALLDRSRQLKAEFGQRRMRQSLPQRVLAMVFEKSSTRTRVSFEAAMAHLGGHAIFIAPADSQLGRGEPVEDMARVLSRMVDCIMVRTHEHGRLERLAANSSVPVINGLTNAHHPCQLLADMQTYEELRGPITGRKVAWIGDANNVCNSYIEAAMRLDFRLHVACPDAYRPDPVLIRAAGDCVAVTSDPAVAADAADVVVTDVWASMGQEQEAALRAEAFRGFQVNAVLMKRARRDALFMHCLPAHRGEEVTAEVIDGSQSAVWEEAGNRLHSQKALLEFLLG